MLNKKSTTVALFFLIFILGVYLFLKGLGSSARIILPTPATTVPLSSPTAPISISLNFEEAKVAKVIDGDTIEVIVNDQVFKVRYIGVDTPETVDPRKKVECFGKEASKENKELVEGRIISLEKDVSEVDSFGRLLRYVYLKIDNDQTLFINDYLIRAGFGKAITFPPDIKYSSRFLEAEKEARDKYLGLWGKCF